MSANDELLARNAARARDDSCVGLGPRPKRRLAIVTCMDARLDPAATLGLAPGDAHVIRNAGGLLTDDVLRSLLVSQRLLGTAEVWLIHHRDCGMEGLDEERLVAGLVAETGKAPDFPLGAFADVRADLLAGAEALRAHPLFVGCTVRTFLYDVDSGALEGVD